MTISVRGDQHAISCCLKVTRLRVSSLALQPQSNHKGAHRERITTPFLKANDVGLGFTKPAEKVWQATVDVIDVETAIFIGSGRAASGSTLALALCFGPSPNESLICEGQASEPPGLRGGRES
jgi:hypothetical protein